MIADLKKLIGQRNPVRIAWHQSKGFAAAIQYGFPAKKLTVIGITGTDGKTTTVGMVAHILNKNGMKTGALSTAFLQIGENIEWNATQKTSPSPFIIQQFLKRCIDEGCTHVVLECSSHGLVQGRLSFIYPSVAAITNISAEHLDYHGTMEQYILDKSLLFKVLKKDGVAVLHYDDLSYTPFMMACSQNRIRSITYNEGLKDIDDKIGPPMDFWIDSSKSTARGSSATVHWITQHPATHSETFLELSIPGSFNIENALCAIACTKALPSPLDFKSIVQSLQSFTGVPGRMERIDEGQNFSVYVDFTVTPAAYEKTLTTLRGMIAPGKRILVLTGSCGDRMKEKRPIVGKLCSELAEVVVVSNEDPYTEDPQKIIDEVWAGVNQSTCEAHQIFDRRAGIEFLLKAAQPGDAVILCAKGSDTTMWVKEGQIPWNEREITREILRTLQ